MTDFADTVFVNGRITTLDRGQPQAQALAVNGGAILAVGSSADVLRHAGPTERQPHAPDPRRPQLQHGAALGRRADAV
jgi:predicted amidohydrolase YtcJ